MDEQEEVQDALIDERFTKPQYLVQQHHDGGVIIRLHPEPHRTQARLFTEDEIVLIVQERLSQSFPVIVGGILYE